MSFKRTRRRSKYFLGRGSDGWLNKCRHYNRKVTPYNKQHPLLLQSQVIMSKSWQVEEIGQIVVLNLFQLTTGTWNNNYNPPLIIIPWSDLLLNCNIDIEGEGKCCSIKWNSSLSLIGIFGEKVKIACSVLIT